MATTGPEADRARAEFRAIAAEKGHVADNAARALTRLEEAFASGALVPTPALDEALQDLRRALVQDEGQKRGGKSAEAARFILRAIDRRLDEA